MRLALSIVVAVAAITFGLVPAASAYKLRGSGCSGNGEECQVFCDSGDLAGSMYWNGSVWTDGVKWNKDQEAMARLVCAANGTACK